MMTLFKVKTCPDCGKKYPSCCIDDCPHPRWVDTEEAKKLLHVDTLEELEGSIFEEVEK